MDARRGYRCGVLGLPERVTACLFDLDGVLTPTAVIHNKAWTRTFDDFLRARGGQRPFDPVEDYNDYVDGKPREAGVRDFLASRGITLPEGTPDDPPDAQTVSGLGSRKNELLLTLIKEGLEPYPGSVRYLQEAAKVGLRRAVVSSAPHFGRVRIGRPQSAKAFASTHRGATASANRTRPRDIRTVVLL